MSNIKDINSAKDVSWDKATDEADLLLQRLDVSDDVKKRVRYCKNVLLNYDSLANDIACSIKFIHFLANKYNVHNKLQLVMENNLSKNIYKLR